MSPQPFRVVLSGKTALLFFEGNAVATPEGKAGELLLLLARHSDPQSSWEVALQLAPEAAEAERAALLRKSLAELRAHLTRLAPRDDDPILETADALQLNPCLCVIETVEPPQTSLSGRITPSRRKGWTLVVACLLMAVGIGFAVVGRHAAHRATPHRISKAEYARLDWQLNDLRDRGTALFEQGDYGQAEGCQNAALTLARELGDNERIANALSQKGQAVEAEGEQERAKALYEQALDLRRKIGPPLAVAHVLDLLGSLDADQGDTRAANTLLTESLTIRRQEKETVGVALCLRELGLLATDTGDYRAAKADFNECLRTVQPLDKPEIVAHVRACLGMVACYEGDFSQARRLVEESLRFWQQRGHPRWIAGMLNRRSVIATYEGHLTAARADAEESLRLYQQVGDAYSAANAQRQLARCLIRQGEIDRADALLRSALAAQTRSNAKRTLLATLEAIALLDATRHESERSVRLLGACAALRQTFAAPLPPVESQAQASVLADLDKALGPQTFQRAQEEGRRLTLQQAISEALP